MAEKLKMHAREYKTMRDPVDRSSNNTKYICYLEAKSIPQELQNWMRTNPRDQKMTTDVAKNITESLKENENFHDLNRGMLFNVDSIHYDNRDESLEITLADGETQGNIDGGHTLRAILNAQLAHENLENRYVQAEFYVRHPNPVELAAARNTSVQVDLRSQEELKKSFDILKELFAGLPFENRVAYHMNQHYGEGIAVLDVRMLIAILNMFNQNLYPVHGPKGPMGAEHPIQSYTGNEVSLTAFLKQGKEKREQILKNMAPSVEDIFKLWDKVEVDFHKKVQSNKHYYGSKKYAKYNNGKVVAKSTFWQHDLTYVVPKGILCPVVGAFRALVNVDPVTGIYSWKKDPFAAWDALGQQMAAIIWDEKEENPEYIGKSRNIWGNLYQGVLLWLLT